MSALNTVTLFQTQWKCDPAQHGIIGSNACNIKKQTFEPIYINKLFVPNSDQMIFIFNTFVKLSQDDALTKSSDDGYVEYTKANMSSIIKNWNPVGFPTGCSRWHLIENMVSNCITLIDVLPISRIVCEQLLDILYKCEFGWQSHNFDMGDYLLRCKCVKYGRFADEPSNLSANTKTNVIN